MSNSSERLDQIEAKLDLLTAMFYAKELAVILAKAFPAFEVTYLPPEIRGEPSTIQLYITRLGTVNVQVLGPESMAINYRDDIGLKMTNIRGPVGVPRERYSMRNELIKILDKLLKP